jgi:hypothetical protein
VAENLSAQTENYKKNFDYELESKVQAQLLSDRNLMVLSLDDAAIRIYAVEECGTVPLQLVVALAFPRLFDLDYRRFGFHESHRPLDLRIADEPLLVLYFRTCDCYGARKGGAARRAETRGR